MYNTNHKVGIMKAEYIRPIFIVLIVILALVPNVNAVGYMDGSNWTGIDNILDSSGYGFLKNSSYFGGYTYLIVNDSGTIKAYDTQGNLNYTGTNIDSILNNMSNGTHLKFGVGTFIISDSHTIALNNIILEGSGKDLTVLDYQNDSNSMLYFDGSNNIMIKDLTLKALNGQPVDRTRFNNSKYIHIENIKINGGGKNYANFAVHFKSDNKYIVLKNIYVMNTEDTGVRFRSMAPEGHPELTNSYVIIDGYYSLGNANVGTSTVGRGDGIDIYGLQNSSLNNIQILGNITSGAGIDGNGIGIYSNAKNLIISNVYIQKAGIGTTGHGIGIVRWKDTDPSDIQLDNIKIIDSGANGIQLFTKPLTDSVGTVNINYGTILNVNMNNINIENSTWSGIQFDGGNVTNINLNNVYINGSNTRGIGMSTDANFSMENLNIDNIVVNNSLTNNGIEFRNTTDALLTNAKIYNSYLTGFTTYGGRRIYLKNIIVNNTITNSGIRVIQYRNVSPSYITISDTNIQNTGVHGILLYGLEGTGLYNNADNNLSNIRIAGAVLEHSQKSGLSLEANVTKNLMVSDIYINDTNVGNTGSPVIFYDSSFENSTLSNSILEAPYIKDGSIASGIQHINVRGMSGYNHGNLATAPTPFGEGDSYYNTVTNSGYVYNGTAWNAYGSTSSYNSTYAIGGFSLSFSNGTSNISTGFVYQLPMLTAGTITQLTAYSIQSGSLNITVTNASTGQYKGSVTITNGTTGSSAGLDYSFNAGDLMNYTVISNTGIKQVTFSQKHIKG